VQGYQLFCFPTYHKKIPCVRMYQLPRNILGCFFTRNLSIFTPKMFRAPASRNTRTKLVFFGMQTCHLATLVRWPGSSNRLRNRLFLVVGDAWVAYVLNSVVEVSGLNAFMQGSVLWCMWKITFWAHTEE
jgi:hypothetical protein